MAQFLRATSKQAVEVTMERPQATNHGRSDVAVPPSLWRLLMPVKDNYRNQFREPKTSLCKERI